MEIPIRLLIAIVIVLPFTVLAQNEVDGAEFTYGLYERPRLEGNADDPRLNVDKTRFRVGQEIYIRPLLINNSSEPLPWTVTDTNWLFIFELRKNGQSLPVGYRTDKARLLSVREEENGAGMIMKPDPIVPWGRQELTEMKLSERFGPLSQGKYTLLIFYKIDRLKKTKEGEKRVRLMHSREFSIYK